MKFDETHEIVQWLANRPLISTSSNDYSNCAQNLLITTVGLSPTCFTQSSSKNFVGSSNLTNQLVLAKLDPKNNNKSEGVGLLFNKF